MDIQLLTAIVSGLGGGLVVAITQAYLAKRNEENKRFFEEKKESYIGLLQSLHQAAVKPSEVNSKEYALWQTRVTLVGSPAVVKHAQGMVDTIPGTAERDKCFDGLLLEMRSDLGVDVRALDTSN